MTLRAQLHVLVDPTLSRGRPLQEIVEAALAGGADVIQLRDKTAEPRELAAFLARALPRVRAAGARLLVNDHWELACDGGADGVHVGARDTPVARVRRACPTPFIIGASARTVQTAKRATEAGADYLGVGPVFGTSSKPDAPAAIGLARISELAADARIPLIGIGGIGSTNVADVIRAGAAGVAVLSAVTAATDPVEATRALRRALDAVIPPRVAGSGPDC